MLCPRDCYDPDMNWEWYEIALWANRFLRRQVKNERVCMWPTCMRAARWMVKRER
jgi:hypothetical protein